VYTPNLADTGRLLGRVGNAVTGIVSGSSLKVDGDSITGTVRLAATAPNRF